jgi:hypothetical protein
MPLSGEELEDFIKTYENAFGERMTAEEASELFVRLLHLYRRIKKVSEDRSDNVSPDKSTGAYGEG